MPPQGASAWGGLCRTRVFAHSTHWLAALGGVMEILNKKCGVTVMGILNKKCGVMEILEKTSQSEPHPRDPLKFRKKPHNLGPIPGTPENPGKNLTIWALSPGPPKILEKTSQSDAFAWLLVGWLLLCRQAVQRPPAGAIS